MAKVAIVEKGVVVYRGVLPKNWKNTSGLHNSKDDWSTLNELGIYPLEEIKPSFNNATEILDSWTEDIQADKVVLTWVKRNKTSAELTADSESEAVAYKWKREQEYPKIEEQLDEIYHNGIDSWKAIIKAVKDKYPKP
jgi:predicted mannosyl-3-phosphoglycerate phosphatase (HAD superfamily)